MMIKVNRYLLTFLFMFSVSGSALCQMLFKPEMEVENYARTGYNLYGRTQINKLLNPRYDYFGNYLMDGFQAFHWDEAKINSRHVDISEKNSYMAKTDPRDQNEFFYYYLDNLVVLNESSKSFSSRFIVGNQIRVKFSPLTLDMAALNGVRWDMDINNNYLTLVNSRADVPLWFPDDYYTDEGRRRLIPLYLTGAHFEKKLGIFNVAANYVNTYKTNSTLSRRQNSITGTIAHEAQLAKPFQLALKIEDGSRWDGGGPRVFEVIPIVNGRKRKELLSGITKGNYKDDFMLTRKLDDPNRETYTNRYYLEPIRMPDFVDFNSQTSSESLRKNFLSKRYNIKSDPLIDFRKLPGNEQGHEYLECNGNDYLIFWFQVPQDENVKSYKFKVLVGNNYLISLAEIYNNKESQYKGYVNSTYFDYVAYSSNDVKDMSNLKWVTIEHGNPTANMLMGLRVDTQVKGFSIISEYNRNLQFKQYSNEKAQKFRNDAEAYYITLKKEFGKLTLGTEYFKLDPDYSTSFRNFDTKYGFMTVYNESFIGDPSLRGSSYSSIGPQSYMNLTQIIDSVDDNDDKDNYPDFHIYREVRDINGVFPGLDKNGNQRPDQNENDNFIPDYDEPFFLYYSDPDEYDYGWDLNNNGTLDEREDDSKPDYPYNLNTKGYHLFGSYGTDVGWKYTLGYINFKRIMNGGINDVKYGSVEYNKFFPFLANVRFASMFKKSKDSIEDNVFKYAKELSTTLIDSTHYAYNLYNEFSGTPVYIDMCSERYYDPLKYRDSYMSNTSFETNIFRIPNLSLGMKLRYEINHQNEASYQRENDIIDRTQIYRADYKWYLRNFLIQPQIKFMTRKYTDVSGYEMTLHEQYLYPILKLEYPLTVNTTFRCGTQGFPGWNAAVRNLVNNDLDYDMRNFVIMLSNKSFYSGYDFCLNIGFQSNWQKFYGEARQAYNRTDRVYFVRMIVGLEPIS